MQEEEEEKIIIFLFTEEVGSTFYFSFINSFIPCIMLYFIENIDDDEEKTYFFSRPYFPGTFPPSISLCPPSVVSTYDVRTTTA